MVREEYFRVIQDIRDKLIAFVRQDPQGKELTYAEKLAWISLRSAANLTERIMHDENDRRAGRESERVSTPVLSTGDPSTLRTYHQYCITIFGADSAATSFISERITKDGEDAVVIQAESQMVHMLRMLHHGNSAPPIGS